ncbi:MAG: hypothetical protein AAFU73_13035 [Planctomycetota bacterium]
MKLVLTLAVCGASVLGAPTAAALRIQPTPGPLPAVGPLPQQGTHFTFDNTTRRIGTIETDAGFLFDGGDAPVPVSATVREIEPVGDELWVAANAGLLRIDRSTLAALGNELSDHRVRAIVPKASGGATLFALNLVTLEREVLDVDASAQVIASTVVDYVPNDAVALGPDFAVVLGNDVVLVDGTTLQSGPAWVTGARALASANSTVYAPDRLFTLPGGNLAVGAGLCIVLADSAGTARRIFNVGSFETAGLSAGGNDLMVLSSDRTTLVEFGSAFEVDAFGLGYGGSPPAVSTHSVPGSASSGRICASGINSTGDAARATVLANREVLDRTLTLVARGMPAGEAAVPFYGLEQPPTPFGSGQLCIDAAGGNLVRAPVAVVGADGSTRTEFDFSTAGLGAEIGAGTSWVFQVAFRDPAGAGIDVTDAVTLEFAP